MTFQFSYGTIYNNRCIVIIILYYIPLFSLMLFVRIKLTFHAKAPVLKK